MTTQHEASRTLVKSPPELWAECSDAESLARHLNEFGEITITRLDPETTVAWEGEHASGTVQIEPSGWGTKVTLTAQTSIEQIEQEESDEAVEETVTEPDPPVAKGAGPIRRGWRRLRSRFGSRAEEPEPAAEEIVQERAAEAPPAPPADDERPVDERPADAEAILSAALDSLGQAHHRPFSRA